MNSHKKSEKNRVLITPRDVAVMKDIAVEPAMLSEIRNRYFRSGDRISSLPAVSRRISKLVKSGYVVRTLKNRKLNFGIGEAGAQYLSERLGYEKKNINVEKGKGFLMDRKKPLKNRWVCVTSRDLFVFERLSSGPAIFETLKKHFTSCDAFARRRLQKLSDCGYIKKVKYPSKPSLLFYISEKGAQELSAKLGYDLDQIRMTIVRPEEVAHELMITEIVKIIKEEEHTGIYEVLTLNDDICGRKDPSFTKGIFIPDIHLHVKTYDGIFFKFNVEVDSGKRPVKAIIEKIKNYGNIVVIITTTSARKNAIKKAIMRDKSVSKRPFMVLFSEIVKEREFVKRNWDRD